MKSPMMAPHIFQTTMDPYLKVNGSKISIHEEIMAIYNKRAPTAVKSMTTPETTNGAGSSGAIMPAAAESEALALGLGATDPEPGSASPVEDPPAFCEPGPSRPGPFPAPSCIN